MMYLSMGPIFKILPRGNRQIQKPHPHANHPRNQIKKIWGKTNKMDRMSRKLKPNILKLNLSFQHLLLIFRSNRKRFQSSAAQKITKLTI